MSDITIWSLIIGTVFLLAALGAGPLRRLAVWVKRHTAKPAASEELLTLGLIGLSYGAALAISAYGFLTSSMVRTSRRIH